MNNQGSKTELANAYRKLANESFMMITDSQQQLNKIQQKEIKEDNQVGKKMKPQSPLVGSNGNIFNLMGIATKSLKEVGMDKEAEEMFERVTKSGSYEEVLNILVDYVEPVDVNEMDQIEMNQQMI